MTYHSVMVKVRKRNSTSQCGLVLLALASAILFLAACGGAPPPATPEPPTATSTTVSKMPTVEPADAASPEPSAEPESTAPRASAQPEASPTRKSATDYADLEIVTLLPRDAIPAIDNPQFLSADEADEFYDPDELVIGVTFNGDARAYSVPLLSNHEIVNDTVGGVKIAVTW